jgi:hypothetical protein
MTLHVAYSGVDGVGSRTTPCTVRTLVRGAWYMIRGIWYMVHGTW